MLTEYNDPNCDDFHLVMPVLEGIPGRTLARAAGTNRRTIDRIRDGQKPQATLRAALTNLAVLSAAVDLTQGLPAAQHARAITRLEHKPTATLSAWHHSVKQNPI